MVQAENIFKLQYFVKFAIYTVLIGQLWSTINSNLRFIKTTDLKEYFFVADCDNTIDCELDFEKHFKDRLCSLTTDLPFFKESKSKHHFYYKNALRPVAHFEIHTPPPDFFLI